MDEETKYRDDYDEDYLTFTEKDGRYVRVEIISFDGFGEQTSRFVDLSWESARALGQDLVELTGGVTDRDREILANIRKRDEERREAEKDGIIGGSRVVFDNAFLLGYISKLED